jgi:hypothetical protein
MLSESGRGVCPNEANTEEKALATADLVRDGRECSKLHFLGQVTLPRGYPLLGQLGEIVATYSIVGDDGSWQDLPVRNGYEVVQANCIHDATRIDPIATQAPAALEFSKDPARDITDSFCGRYPSSQAAFKGSSVA